MNIISKSEKETLKFAANIAKASKPGDVFALEGDLGSGKTTFAKGFAAGLEIEKPVTSPTFVIMKKYDVLKNPNGIKQLVHLDCYRFGHPSEIESVGLSEYCQDGVSVILLEWPEKADLSAFPNIQRISFEFTDENSRKINIKN